MKYCTLAPDWNHGNYCQQHDIDYAFQVNKFTADWKLFKGVSKESGLLTGVVFYFFTSTLGWFWYIKAGRELNEYGLE